MKGGYANIFLERLWMCLSLFNAPEGGYAVKERKLCQKIIFLKFALCV